MPETSTTTSLSGRTFRWKFADGPTAGATYEHTFEPDGSVVFRKVEDGTASGKARARRSTRRSGSRRRYSSYLRKKF